MACPSAGVPSKRSSSTVAAGNKQAAKKQRSTAVTTLAPAEQPPSQEPAAPAVFVATGPESSTKQAADSVAEVTDAKAGQAHPELGVPPDPDAALEYQCGKPVWIWMNDKGEEVTVVRYNVYPKCARWCLRLRRTMARFQCQTPTLAKL
jgi:hypothetical protein